MKQMQAQAWSEMKWANNMAKAQQMEGQVTKMLLLIINIEVDLLLLSEYITRGSLKAVF